MTAKLDPRVPFGPLETKWRHYRDHLKLVAPNNRRRFEIIIVGSGLAGASAAATLGEAGYKVKCFTFHDSPRRAHSIAAQGGINAAKNYRNDGDSVYRLFYDTIKGWRFPLSRGQRLSPSGSERRDHRPGPSLKAGQQLLLGAYQALSRQVQAGTVKLFPRTEMLDLVVEGGRARGHRGARPGERRGRVSRWARGRTCHRGPRIAMAVGFGRDPDTPVVAQ